MACHESRLGGDPTLVAELLEHRAAEEGRRAGVLHAEAFRRLRFAGLGAASVAVVGGPGVPLAHGAEGEDRDDADADRADHGAEEAGGAREGRAVVRALEVDEAVADEPAAEAADRIATKARTRAPVGGSAVGA